MSIEEMIWLWIEKVKLKFVDAFPDKPFTVMVLIWDDGDFKITCQYGDKQFIHKMIYHDSLHDDGITYEKEEYASDAVKIDKDGNRFYIPDELIPYLNGNKQQNILGEGYNTSYDGEYYALPPNTTAWSVDLQQNVSFQKPIYIQITNTVIGSTTAFFRIVDVSVYPENTGYKPTIRSTTNVVSCDINKVTKVDLEKATYESLKALNDE